jgi:hypothetical protein
MSGGKSVRSLYFFEFLLHFQNSFFSILVVSFSPPATFVCQQSVTSCPHAPISQSITTLFLAQQHTYILSLTHLSHTSPQYQGTSCRCSNVTHPCWGPNKTIHLSSHGQ